MGQYLQEPDTARESAAYYQLYQKYGADVTNPGILRWRDFSGKRKCRTRRAESEKWQGMQASRSGCTGIHLLLDGLAEAFTLFSWLDDRAAKTQETLKQLKKELERGEEYRISGRICGKETPAASYEGTDGAWYKTGTAFGTGSFCSCLKRIKTR